MALDLQQTLGFLLNDVARLLRKRFEQRARHLGLTRAQWQVLAYVARHEGIHQQALAEILEIEPITLVRLIDRIEAAGLVERRQHPKDRRVRLLHLTPAAHPILEEMRKIGQATREEALAEISPADRERLTEILLSMRGNLIEVASDGGERTREASHG